MSTKGCGKFSKLGFTLFGLMLGVFVLCGSGLARAESEAGAFENLWLNLESSSADFQNITWTTKLNTTDAKILVLTIESDAIPGTSRLELSRDEASGALTGLYYYPADGSTIAYTFAQLRQKPQVLKKMSGYDVILAGLEKDFDPAKGGHVFVRYMTNALSSNYKNFRILLDIQGTSIVLRGDPNPRDPESDDNPYNSVFNYLYFEKNTVFGKVVGIDSVHPAVK